MRKSFKINLELSYLDGHIQSTYCINEITLKKTPSIYTHNAQTNTTDPCVYTPYTDKHSHPAPNKHTHNTTYKTASLPMNFMTFYLMRPKKF